MTATTPTQDDAKEEDDDATLFVVDHTGHRYQLMCEPGQFEAIREAILATLPTSVLPENFDRGNIHEITLTDVSKDVKKPNEIVAAALLFISGLLASLIVFVLVVRSLAG
jgi:hypothetical protein